jgi:hypothetical protein
VTDLLDGFVAVLVFLLVNVVLVARIAASPSPWAPWLARVFAGTLLLRAALALLLNAFSANSAFAAAFWGDSGTYDAAGSALARNWHGEAASTTLTQAVSGYGFVYIVGAVYYVFGRNQLLVQLLNCSIGAATVLVVHAIATRLLGATAARWAALLMAFLPQMVFWSAGMYKDPTVLLCIALCIYAVLRLREASPRRTWGCSWQRACCSSRCASTSSISSSPRLSAPLSSLVAEVLRAGWLRGSSSSASSGWVSPSASARRRSRPRPPS